MNRGRRRGRHAVDSAGVLLARYAADFGALAKLGGACVVVLPDGRAFVYRPGPPRLGNLVMSHSDIGPGVDLFGNDHAAGDAVYDGPVW